jgi:hypothetical protein
MARRRLLREGERRSLFALPTDAASIASHYTLSSDDLELVGRRHGATNRLGMAVQIALMRHPGFGLQPDIGVPHAILRYLADQLALDPDSFASYGQRAQTRSGHADLAARHLRFRPFRRREIQRAQDLAAKAAERSDRGEPIVRALMEGLKQERYILPSPDTLERLGLAGRAPARKGAAALLVESLGCAELARINALIVNNSDFGMTPLAWLRNFEEGPTMANITGLLERLRYVRGIGIDLAIAARISDFHFILFMREGNAAPAFLLSDYSLNRRRATLVAAVVDLEVKLADEAIGMFDRLVGSLFTRSRRGRKRRYQDSIRSVGELMRLFGATIAALGEAVEHSRDPLDLINEAVGWHRLVAAKPQVDALADLAGEDALVAVRPTTYLLCAISSASASCPACATSPTASSARSPRHQPTRASKASWAAQSGPPRSRPIGRISSGLLPPSRRVPLPPPRSCASWRPTSARTGSTSRWLNLAVSNARCSHSTG